MRQRRGIPSGTEAALCDPKRTLGEFRCCLDDVGVRQYEVNIDAISVRAVSERPEDWTVNIGRPLMSARVKCRSVAREVSSATVEARRGSKGSAHRR